MIIGLVKNLFSLAGPLKLKFYKHEKIFEERIFAQKFKRALEISSIILFQISMYFFLKKHTFYNYFSFNISFNKLLPLIVDIKS